MTDIFETLIELSYIGIFLLLIGIETARRLREASAEARIIFLTVHDDPGYVREALEAGALGYVIQHRIASDLVAAIQEAYSGRPFLSPSLTAL